MLRLKRNRKADACYGWYSYVVYDKETKKRIFGTLDANKPTLQNLKNAICSSLQAYSMRLHKFR